ncbi:MAG: 2-oxoisovalerate dehydrogenase [Cyclobacteriaceae bacterium]|nr:2-oxoisovalerate dehydrogenase [Cyclobacteriaceae bacterium]
MNSEIIIVVEESPEGGYIARALGESIFTEADTLEELKINVKEAVKTHYDEGQHPKIIRLHFTREELIPV